MTFLALILALLAEQWQPLRTGNVLYVAFARYVDRIAQSFNAGQSRDGAISWALAVLPAVLLVIVVHLLSRQLSWIAVLGWNVAVLYLALGFRQFSHFYTDITAALRAGDLAQAKQLQALGATLAVPELQVASKRLIAGLLASLNRPEEEIQRALEVLRG